MKYWVFIVTSQKENGDLVPASEIWQTRMANQFWGLGERTANRKTIKTGDQIVIYEGNPVKSFVASAQLASESFVLSDSEKEAYRHGREVFTTDYGVRLENIRIFQQPIPMQDVLEGLAFIENKPYWGTYLQGGTREIFERDYHLIIGARPNTLIEQLKVEEDLESESQFALEAHLEEFMFNNWSRINFGEKLELFSDGEQNGRQFPAETWSIDFLCLDSNGDFVIIELKRGKTSDAVVGQVLRYIGWVKENLAAPGQEVRGIIIAHDIDAALRYAVSGLSNVRLMTYRVDFRLEG